MDQNQTVTPSQPTEVPQAKAQNSWAVPLAIVIAGALIAGAVYMSGKKTTGPQVLNQDTQKETKYRPVDDSDHVLGNPKAKVLIVEYSDLECPYCQDFHVEMKKVMDAYGKDGDVAWVYRHFWSERKLPSGEIFHPMGGTAAESSECVAELGGEEKFWAFTDIVFAGQPGSLQKLSDIASGIGINKEAFDSCVSSGKYKDQIEAAYKEGLEAGVTGTPNSLIILDGEFTTIVPGFAPFEDLKGYLDSVL